MICTMLFFPGCHGNCAIQYYYYTRPATHAFRICMSFFLYYCTVHTSNGISILRLAYSYLLVAIYFTFPFIFFILYSLGNLEKKSTAILLLWVNTIQAVTTIMWLSIWLVCRFVLIDVICLPNRFVYTKNVSGKRFYASRAA